MKALQTFYFILLLIPTVFFLAILYLFASNFFYRLAPGLYEWYGLKCFKWIVFVLGIKIKYHYENTGALPPKAIYICNHSSSFEIFIITILLKRTHYVINADALKVPLLSKILSKGPLIWADPRSTRSRALAIQQIGTTLQQGRNVMLFPEGHSHKFLSPRFANGAFRAAMDTGTPIVPIYLHYENLEAFVPDERVDHKKEFFRILFARNKIINAYFFDHAEPGPFQSVDEFRDAMYQKYCEWQRRFYQC